MMGSVRVCSVSEKKIADKNEFSLEALKLQEKSHFTYQHWNITNVNRIIISVNIV